VLYEESKKNGIIIDRVYRSPLTRAGETLSIIRRHAPMVPQTETVHPNLTGINLYAWEGRNQSDLKVNDAEAYRSWVEGDAHSFTISGRRPVTEIWDRAGRVWDTLRSAVVAVAAVTHDETRTDYSAVIICHGTLGQALLCTAFGWDETHFRRLPFLDDNQTTMATFDLPNCGMVEILWRSDENRAMSWRWLYPKSSLWMQPLGEHEMVVIE
jgi:broad specificity phosphatase PhoE